LKPEGKTRAFCLQVVHFSSLSKEPNSVGLTCPNCGNARNFLVKTLQMHVVQLDDSRVEVAEEGKPGVIELLCDECETTLNFDEVEEGLRREVLLSLGAR
jgi:hypothetical protein